MKLASVVTVLTVAWLGGHYVFATPAADLSATADFFEKQVRPLLAERCLSCHGNKLQKSGLRLDSRAAMLTGGSRGPALMPGDPEKSALIHAIRYDGKVKMPPTGKLSDDEIATLTIWVRSGARWPDVPNAPPATRNANHWSFRPVRKPSPPLVRNKSWVQNPLDAFILARLEQQQLTPAPPADKRTLIRRATFDLIGLPPSTEEVRDFLADSSPTAFAKVIDRLLDSPHFGERWGRHWLDVVRYCDSFDARILSGDGTVMDVTEAWRYRDWVVNAFNRDLPYDQFIIHQIAGDLIPPPNGTGFSVTGTIATGMLAIGNWGGGDADKEKLLTDIADDQVDVVSRAFMGLTVSCARCHDHKFDPIATEDYYGLAGIFFSTHILRDVGPKTNGPPMLRIPLASKTELARREQHQARVAELERLLTTTRQAKYREFAQSLLPQTSRYLVAAWEYQRSGNAPVEAFASERGLQAFALRQWRDELSASQYRLMTNPLRDVRGFKGVHGFNSGVDCPNLLVNSNDKELAILTFKLPPKSVAVHPGPTNGVVVSWQSPINGTVRVTGRVADADPAGGDGIAWLLDHRAFAGARELAAGDIPNGGMQSFAQGKSAAQLLSVEVKIGDAIQLLVLPKANHTCDTTTVEFAIASTDSSALWDLTKDLVGELKQNPHPDSMGHANVWQFLDMARLTGASADSKRGTDASGAPNSALAPVRRAMAGAERAAIERAAQEFAQTFDFADNRSPFWIRNRDDEKHLAREARAALTNLTDELARLKKETPPPLEYANGAQEGGVPGSPHEGLHDVKVHVRGRYDRLGNLVPRHFPVVLAGDQQPSLAQGSGRLELAQWIARREHPLTARVMVNRLWQHLFGEGLVRTPGNFGKLGERPTHPELLDALASQFAQDWSIKRMLRTMMLSSTYQQSSNECRVPSVEKRREPSLVTRHSSRSVDPDNRLFGRMNRKRLEAECIRDSLLAVSGRLDPAMGDRATRDFMNPRRTLYQMTVRSDRANFGALFDVADSTAIIDRRTVSTVAPQSLFMLNNRFVLEQTKSLAKRIVDAKPENRARLHHAYELLYGRPPRAEELHIGLTFLASGGEEKKAWEEYCQILLCANEFVYVD